MCHDHSCTHLSLTFMEKTAPVCNAHSLTSQQRSVREVFPSPMDSPFGSVSCCPKVKKCIKAPILESKSRLNRGEKESGTTINEWDTWPIPRSTVFQVVHEYILVPVAPWTQDFFSWKQGHQLEEKQLLSPCVHQELSGFPLHSQSYPGFEEGV